jgi:hypothetical protein
MLPHLSVARTRTRCSPALRSRNVAGEEHTRQAPASSAHAVRTTGETSRAWKVAVAAPACALTRGVLGNVTLGAVASALKRRTAGGEIRPLAVTPRTRNVCQPVDRRVGDRCTPAPEQRL